MQTNKGWLWLWLVMIPLAMLLGNCTGITSAPPLTRGVPLVAPPALQPLPHVIAELPLAAPGQALLDFLLDPATQRIYVTATSGQLSVLDATTYRVLATLPVMGYLTLDAPSRRLYVSPVAWVVEGVAEPTISVIDTTTNTLIGALPGQVVAIDAVHDRLFVGEWADSSTGKAAVGIRRYDATTLIQSGQLTQVGAPYYNPLRNELLVIAHTVYQVDPESGAVISDLFPELAEQTMLWCNGCTWVDELHLFPAENLLAIWVETHCTGGGCTVHKPPTFFNATTLERYHTLAGLPEVRKLCGRRTLLEQPLDGRIYRSYSFARYVGFNNLIVDDEQGREITWRDGIAVQFINPQTAQAYLAGGDLLDLKTLTPVGSWPDSCLFAYAADRGLLYAAGNYAQDGTSQRHILQVIDQAGGESSVTPASASPRPAALTGHALTMILPAPSYGQDRTIMVVADDMTLFRSTDGGASWLILRGGLPTAAPLTLQVAFSPTYGKDRTLFAAGYRDEGRGEGVWRSTDGGDTWRPLWQGLTHLRITALLLSPAFTDDQTMLVKGEYYRVDSGQSGASWQRSTDGGIHWSVVATSTYDAPLPDATVLLPALAATTVTLPVRLTGYDHRVEYSADQGVTWRPAPLPLAADEWVQTIIPAPTKSGTADKMIYVLSDYHLWRTPDGGHQWEVWVDPLAIPRTYTNALRTLAISPLLADGAYYLFLGTTDGQFLLPNPTADWLPIHHTQ